MVTIEEAKENINTLILFCREQPWFARFERPLLEMEELLDESEKGVQQDDTGEEVR